MRRLLLVLPVLILTGCSDEDVPSPALPGPDPPYVPPVESCDLPDIDVPRAFRHCSLGSGVFGTWVVDDRGLFAYDYGLDQNADPRASFFNTEQRDRRDHWAAFGNARVNALFFNDGYIEVTTQDRGATYLNKFDEAQGNFAGGFSYLDDGAETWSTAYKWRPRGSRTTRRFGMGYAEATMLHAGILLERRTFSPEGDAPVVIDEVTVENQGNTPRSLRHYEIWDVGRRPIEINWTVSGVPFALAPATAAAARDERNGLFEEAITWEPDERILGLRRAHAAGVTAPPRADPSEIDHYPGDPFVVALVGDVADVYTDQAAFFGNGGVASPAAVGARAPGDGVTGGPVGPGGNGLGQPRMLGLRSDIDLAPGERRTLRFVYGYAPMGEPFVVDPGWRDPSRDLLGEHTDALRSRLLYFAPDRDPVLHRELAWHAYQMEASVGYRDYWQGHVVPQGSAYLYLHGADGAARDLGLFALPLVYTHPALAKEELALYMGITHFEGRRFSYAFQGHGRLDDALGIHDQPSDLALFFLWALGEYLGATGDLAFLDQPMPFWPRDAAPDAIVWDHLHDAVRHLFDVVGTGEHGLIRVQTGDWSDGIVFEAPDRDLAVAAGESVPNTQMAITVLPRVADLIEPRDAALAAEIRQRVEAMREAVQVAWTGSFFGRAYFGDGELAHADKVNLEAQVWALLGDTFVSPGDREALLEVVKSELDAPSSTGAALVPGGQIWPAISALLTWGYAREDAELGWGHLVRNTMAAHAVSYPEIWYGIWSGPDGLNGSAGDRPGQSWFSPVTPMVDFPTMNNNQHAMPMLAALRVAGLEATASGLDIAPRVPGRTFSLSTQLVDLDQRGATLRGLYRPTGGITRTLRVHAPPGATVASASVDGVPVAIGPGATLVELDVIVAPGGQASFEVQMSE